MTTTQALREASTIYMLGPQEQFYGRYNGRDIASLVLDGLRIGAHFVEFEIVCANSQAEHYMFALDDFTLINVW